MLWNCSEEMGMLGVSVMMNAVIVKETLTLIGKDR